ncbi:MAG: TonB-dependent siderophore receptor [Vicinamibacterales bacterium]
MLRRPVRPFRRPRRRGAVRFFSISALVMSAALAAAPAGAQVAQPTPAVRDTTLVRVDIAAGPLDSAIRALEAATGLSVVVQLPADTVGMMTSPGVSGAYTIEAAFAALLDGTSLAATRRDDGVFVIDVRGVRESVEVTGRLPRVESPKYATTLAATPQTIQVIPHAAMAEQGSFTLSDAMRNVPGITLQAGEGGGASGTAGDMFNMRGFSAANSLFVDNVRDDGLVTRDVFNLEQVEVYLGPTGADVGRGNAAGYVNMTTKAPHLGNAHIATVSYGSAEARRATADLNAQLPIGEPGRWLAGTSVRLNALWQDGGVAGRDYVESGRKAIAPSVAMGLGTPTRVVLQGQFTRQDSLPDYGIPGAAWDQPLTPTTVLTTRPVAQDTYYGSPDYDYDEARQASVTGRVEHDLSARWSVRNQTRVNETTREAVVTAIQSVASYLPETETVTFSRQVNRRENRILSNQTAVTGRLTTGRVAHALTIGVELTSEDYSAPGLTGGGTRAADSVYTPNPFAPIADFAPRPSGATTEATTRTLALSAFDVATLGRLQLNGGLRVERYDTVYRAVATTGLRTDLDAADTIVSGKAGVLFPLTPAANLYASYGRTVTPPGSGNFALSAQSNNANNPNVAPQISRHLEVGAKWDLLRRRLSATAAWFDTRNENVIYTIDATTVPPLFNQDDAQILHGATIGLVGQITDRWSVMANTAWLDGRQDSQAVATDGRQLTLMPEWSGSLWTTYAVRGFTAGGGVRFSDRVFVNTANTISVPACHLVDAVASYAVNAHLTLRLNGYNLTDEVYIRSVNNNGGRYNPGFRRALLLSTQIGF